MSYNDIDPADWTYYNPDYSDDDFDEDYPGEDCSNSKNYIEEDKNSEHLTNKNIIDEEPKLQKVKTSEKSRLVTKELSTCQSNKQIRNKSIKILLNMHIKDCVFYYAKYEYLPERYVNLAKEKNCLETIIKSFLKTHLHYDLTLPIVNEINSLLYTIYNNIEKNIVYERVKKIQKFIHEKADNNYGNNAHITLSPKAMRKLLSTARLHLNIFDARVLEPEVLMLIIEKSTNEHLKHHNAKFTFSGRKTKRDNSKDFESLARMDSTLNLAIKEIYDLDLNDQITSYRERALSIFESYSF